jgi:hypothetical protein
MAFYCSSCGKSLDDDTRYCPSCGFDTADQGNNNKPNYNGNYNRDSQGMGGTLTIILVFGIIWAILSVISGIISILGGSLLGTLLYFGGGFMVIVGILSFLSGLFALLCCINIYKLENHSKACTYCLIGSIIALLTGGILPGIIGIIFYFLMKKENGRFSS